MVRRDRIKEKSTNKSKEKETRTGKRQIQCESNIRKGRWRQSHERRMYMLAA